jgi:hypothetical protein
MAGYLGALPAARKPRIGGAGGTAGEAPHFTTGSEFESKTMRLWQRLLLIVPAGLLLGMAGGQFAQPVMTQRLGDEPWQSMFQTRADRDGASSDYPTQPEGPMTYDGGYSYAPAWASHDDWSPPDYYHYSDVPLPTLAELDARQAALLADPEKQFASTPPPEAVEQAADDAEAAADQARQSATVPAASVAAADPAELAPEPHTADGQPAIW